MDAWFESSKVAAVGRLVSAHSSFYSGGIIQVETLASFAAVIASLSLGVIIGSAVYSISGRYSG